MSLTLVLRISQIQIKYVSIREVLTKYWLCIEVLVKYQYWLNIGKD